MNTRKLIIFTILVLLVGAMFYALINLNFSYYKSNCKQNISSNWNNSNNIFGIANSDEKIVYKKVDIIVRLNKKVIGDTSATDPLVIDLSREKIIIKNELLCKSCKVNFTKKIQQEFNTYTDLTSIKTNCSGKIIYSTDYKIVGICKYEEAEKMIRDKIMNDIYTEAKNNHY